MKTTIYDIETGPLPEDEIIHLAPEFSAPANYKDATKIAAAIEDQKKAWIERAALSAVTGRVVAIGIRQEGKTTIIGEDNEAAMLIQWWAAVEQAARERRVMVGFNSHRFDLPFLVRRSWHHKVPVPPGVFGARGYVNSEVFMDLMNEWQCGDRQEWVKLDVLCKFLGLPGKNGNGKDFAGLWAIDREKALAYLENDLEQTARVMERLLGISELSAPVRVAEPPTLTLVADDEDY